MRKNGWWDTFTISETPCKKGITLCSIREFTQDKTGYLMLIVVPVKHLGLTIDEQSAAWDYLYRSGNFSSQYMNHSHANRWNEEALNEKFADLFKSEKEIFLNNPIMKKYYLGLMNIKTIYLMKQNIQLKELQQSLYLIIEIKPLLQVYLMVLQNQEKQLDI